MWTDIHFGNILLRLPKAIDDYSKDQFYVKYKEPFYEPIERLNNQPLPTRVLTYAIVPV